MRLRQEQLPPVIGSTSPHPLSVAQSTDAPAMEDAVQDVPIIQSTAAGDGVPQQGPSHQVFRGNLQSTTPALSKNVTFHFPSQRTLPPRKLVTLHLPSQQLPATGRKRSAGTILEGIEEAALEADTSPAATPQPDLPPSPSGKSKGKQRADDDDDPRVIDHFDRRSAPPNHPSFELDHERPSCLHRHERTAPKGSVRAMPATSASKTPRPDWEGMGFETFWTVNPATGFVKERVVFKGRQLPNTPDVWFDVFIADQARRSDNVRIRGV